LCYDRDMKKTAAKKRASKRPAAFVSRPRLATRGVSRTQFHVLLDEKQRSKLLRLANARKVNAADVVRQLITAAK
jgi:hypothetical protein